MRIGTFLIGIIIGALAWWGLCFIPAVADFDQASHDKVVEWTQSDEVEDTTE